MLSQRSKRTITEIQASRISERQEEPCQPLIIGLFVVIIVIVLGTSNCFVYNGKGKWGLQVFPVGLHNSLRIQIEISR